MRRYILGFALALIGERFWFVFFVFFLAFCFGLIFCKSLKIFVNVSQLTLCTSHAAAHTPKILCRIYLVDISASDLEGVSPLFIAVQRGSIHLLDFLLLK